MRIFAMTFLLLAVPSMVECPCLGADDIAPVFPDPGTSVPRSFCPLVVNGDWKNRNGDPVDRYHSVICHFGLNPVVLVFGRDPKDDALFDFLKQLEAKVTANKETHLGGCAIFLNHDDRRDKVEIKTKDLIKAANDQENLVKLLKEKAKGAGLKKVLVGIDATAGPKGSTSNPGQT
jgi:hypothetical protein